MKINKDKFSKLVHSISSRDTSSDPKHWNKNNPLWGHCAVVALLAQDYFDGDLIRGSLAEIETYAYLKSHFWNKLPNGEEIDFTKDQYKGSSCLKARDIEPILAPRLGNVKAIAFPFLSLYVANKDLSIHNLIGELRSRESILNHPDTIRRYNLLKERLLDL